MIPVTYKMIDLNGLDLAEINGREVPGIYYKIASAYNTSRFAIMCNWCFARILIPPSYVLITRVSENEFAIEDVILVKSDDTVSVVGIVPEPVLEQLEVAENGTYTPRIGVDGFSSVDVNVSSDPPVLVQLTVTDNGIYTPEQGTDGFSRVDVNVQSPYEYINVTYCGYTYAWLYPGGGTLFRYTGPEGDKACMSYFDISPGNYVVFASDPSGNRYRAMFFSGKTYEADFEPYVFTPATSAPFYTCDLNVTGSSDLTGNDMLRRFYFTVTQSGVLCVQTSGGRYSTDPINGTVLFKII